MDLISRYHSVVRGIVQDNKDPQNLRRVKVAVPQITGNYVTDWVWPMISTQKPPSIGQGVWINYIGGDPEYPVWIGEFAKRETNPSHAPTGPFFQGIFSYGSFFSTQTQTPAGTQVGQVVTLNSTDASEGVFIKNSSQIHVDYNAMYNIQFSLQIHHTTGGGGGSGQSIWIWLAKNGTAVPSSSTHVHVPSGQFSVAAWNFFQYLNKGDYAQLYWSTSNLDMRIEAGGSTGGGPNVPSVILTVAQVS